MCLFPQTRVLTPLMTRIPDLHKAHLWFNSAIVPVSSAHDPILVATGNCVTGWHRDDDPPTEVVASLSRGHKIWVFVSKGFKEAAHLSNVKEANKQINLRSSLKGSFLRGSEVSHIVWKKLETLFVYLLAGHIWYYP